jgi:hypothetical protein
VDWWVRYYPPRVFRGLVLRMEAIIREGRLRISREVREELEQQDDELCAWMQAQDGLCIESDEAIQRTVSALMRTFIDPDKPDKGINGADPFVIAIAANGNPQEWMVVSGEKPGTAENPKIPWVCRHLHPHAIQHLSFLEFVLTEGWEFH